MPNPTLAFKTEAEAQTLISEIEAILKDANKVTNWTKRGARLKKSDLKIAKREWNDINKIMKDLKRMALRTGKLFEQYKLIHEWFQKPGSTNVVATIEAELVNDEQELAEIEKLIADIKAWDKKIQLTINAELDTSVTIDKLADHMENIANTIKEHLVRAQQDTAKLL